MPADALPSAAPGPGDVRSPAPGASGRWLVVGLLALGATAGIAAIAYQLRQTGRCLAFYGVDVARRVSEAPVVEVWRLAPTSDAGVLRTVARRDVSRAPGLVHLRRGLVEDANFSWPPGEPSPQRLSGDVWDVALVFSDPEQGGGTATLVIDLPAAGVPGGTLAVVGRPGRIGLGRIAKGLGKWLETLPENP